MERKHNYSVLGQILLVAVLLVVVDRLAMVNPVKAFFEKIIVVPVREVLYRHQQSGIIKMELSDDTEPSTEIMSLQAKIAMLEDENRSQKRMLSAQIPADWRLQPVKIIGLEGDQLLINGGTGLGIWVGNSVVWDNYYIGVVKYASVLVSRVSLASDIGTKLAVKLVNKDDKELVGRGLMMGKGEDRMKIEQILSSEIVQTGDLVTTVLDGGELLVGEIEEVTRDAGGAFKNATAKSLLSPEKLDTVFVRLGKVGQ